MMQLNLMRSYFKMAKKKISSWKREMLFGDSMNKEEEEKEEKECIQKKL